MTTPAQLAAADRIHAQVREAANQLTDTISAKHGTVPDVRAFAHAAVTVTDTVCRLGAGGPLCELQYAISLATMALVQKLRAERELAELLARTDTP